MVALASVLHQYSGCNMLQKDPPTSGIGQISISVATPEQHKLTLRLKTCEGIFFFFFNSARRLLSFLLVSTGFKPFSAPELKIPMQNFFFFLNELLVKIELQMVLNFATLTFQHAYRSCGE